MTPSEALLTFTLEVTRASRELGVEAPKVESIALGEDGLVQGVTLGTIAYYIHESKFRGPRVVILPHYLGRAAGLGERRGTRWLRCIARHEAVHAAKGHVTRDRATDEANHAAVEAEMMARWRERDTSCYALS